MSDRIMLSGLRVRGHHGVLATERRAGQDFVVDVSLDLDLGPAASSDDVADTVDYGELAQALAAVVSDEPVNLLELSPCGSPTSVWLTAGWQPRPLPCTSRRRRSRCPSTTSP